MGYGALLDVPTIYADGKDKALLIDERLAGTYGSYLSVGDPTADTVMADLSHMDKTRQQIFLRAVLNLDDAVLQSAPQSVQDLAHESGVLPEWYDRETAINGCRVFLAHPNEVLTGFAGGAIVEGFSTMISRSFAATGRMIDDGVRRLKQNIRHLYDIFLPLGVEPLGDGWRLSVRIRLVHARVRKLIRESDDWDLDAWGEPVSAAHAAMASATFSARLLQLVEKLGVSLNSEEREAFMSVWVYAAKLMGVPEPLMFYSQKEGLQLLRVARAFEPPPEFEAVALAHCIVNSAPVVVGIAEPKKRAAFARYAFRISRGLVGDSTADQLRFPSKHPIPILPWVRMQGRLQKRAAKFIPAVGRMQRFGTFSKLLTLSDVGESHVSTRLPDHVVADQSIDW